MHKSRVICQTETPYLFLYLVLINVRIYLDCGIFFADRNDGSALENRFEWFPNISSSLVMEDTNS